MIEITRKDLREVLEDKGISVGGKTLKEFEEFVEYGLWDCLREDAHEFAVNLKKEAEYNDTIRINGRRTERT